MPGYPPALLDEIRARVDLVELVGRFVTLRRAGQNWKGLCPFHAEKTPSFMVNPRKGIFHCFGCGVGGDAFGFLMRQDRLTFPEAVRALAREAGVPLPATGGEAREAGREALVAAMELAARVYAERLWAPAGARARAYLERRGVDPAVARRFGLGYAPDGWDGLLGALRAEGLAVETLEQAGLVVRREGGTGHYDRFRGRLMFPIRDVQGRVVAFGGRALGDETPKYLNSPETPLYTKGNLLYALDLAREAIRERRRALLVEGYLDCLMAHQSGFPETVATLGTAFTPAQLAMLRRYCEEVVTFFDGDAAGHRAAERAAELLEPSAAATVWAVNRAGAFADGPPFRLRAALLPAGHDPDTFLRTHGPAAFAERIAAARSLLGYALDRALEAEGEGAPASPRARATAFARAALLLAKVADPAEAAALSREAAARLGVDAAQLWIEAQKLQAALHRPPAPPPRPEGRRARAEDRALVRLLLGHPPARAVLLPLVDEAELDAPLAAIVAALRARPDAPPASLLPELADDARDLLAALLVEDDARPTPDPARAIEDFRRRLELAGRLRRLREVSRSIAAAGAADLPVEALRLLERESREVRARALGLAERASHGTSGSARSRDA